MRVGPSQLAGRVDADRESKGWVDGRGRRGQGSRRGEGRGGTRRVARSERVADRRIGENRARLGFAMTNGRRGHSARRSYRSKGDYYVGLSVECLSLARVTSSVLAEDPSSSSFFRPEPHRAGPRCIFLLFVRFIARPLFRAISSFLYRLFAP